MSVGSPFDVAVIGAGVVGCGVARALTLQGFKVVVLERDDAVAAGWASGGNTGSFCGEPNVGRDEYELHLICPTFVSMHQLTFVMIPMAI